MEGLKEGGDWAQFQIQQGKVRIYSQGAGAVLTRFFLKAGRVIRYYPGMVGHDEFEQMWKMGILAKLT